MHSPLSSVPVNKTRAPRRSARQPQQTGSPCTGARVRRASRALTHLYDEALLPTGLRLTQYSLLRNVERMGPVRISTLAEALLIERTALSRNLEPLAIRRLVAITPGTDARTREVAITDAGRRQLARAIACWMKAQAEVERHFGVERLATLHQLLHELERLRPAANAGTDPE